MRSFIALMLYLQYSFCCALPEILFAPKYQNALIYAAKTGNAEALKRIVNSQNVNAVDETGRSALHYAVNYDLEDITDILIQNGANVNAVDTPDLNTPLHLAAKHGYEAIVNRLVEKCANVNLVNAKIQTSLHMAALGDNTRIAKLLIDLGSDPNLPDKNGDTPLHIASRYDNKEMIEVMLKNGGDGALLNEAGESVLNWAASRGYRGITALIQKQTNSF